MSNFTAEGEFGATNGDEQSRNDDHSAGTGRSGRFRGAKLRRLLSKYAQALWREQRLALQGNATLKAKTTTTTTETTTTTAQIR